VSVPYFALAAALFAVAVTPAARDAAPAPGLVVLAQSLPASDAAGNVNDNLNDHSHYATGMNIYDDTVRPGGDMTLDDTPGLEASQARQDQSLARQYGEQQQRDLTAEHQIDEINQPAYQQQLENQFSQQKNSLP
jgi:hypothetical protein